MGDGFIKVQDFYKKVGRFIQEKQNGKDWAWLHNEKVSYFVSLLTVSVYSKDDDLSLKCVEY